MKDYDDAIASLQDAQDYEYDIRAMCREQEAAMYVRGGQWEDDYWNRLADRPRYTIDLMFPLAKQIASDMGKTSFSMNALPGNSDATKETAEVYSGAFRNIEMISDAQQVYASAGRSIVDCGISGWRVELKHSRPENFDMDLSIKYTPNFKDRVWFNAGAENQDMSDATKCHVLTPMSPDAYKNKYPKGGGESVSQNRQSDYLYYKAESVVVGEYFEKRKKKKKLIQMTNGMVFEDNDETRMILDELAMLDIRVNSERDAEIDVVWTRKYDGDDWLTDPVETVFSYIPVIPAYANFKIIEDKIVYFGLPEKLLDVQRITNYTVSRLTEDTSLRPKSKLMMTKEQAAGHAARLKTMNTDNRPVLEYNHIDNQPPPFYVQPAAPDPTLITLMQTSSEYTNKITSLYSANVGENPGLQSGKAIQEQIAQGSNGSYDFFISMAIAITHTARVCAGPMAEVYGDRETIRTVGEDGTVDFTNLMERVTDQQTGEEIKLIDMTKGCYEFKCTIGPTYDSKQQETYSNILEIAAVYPQILEIGADILLNSVNAPGIKQIAERQRALMVPQGVIPEDQLKDDEKARLQQMQAQPQPPDPVAEAQVEFAQAETKRVEVETADTMSKAQERADKTDLKQQELSLKANELTLKANDQQKQFMLDIINQFSNQDKTDAETLKLLKEVSGADAIIDPGLIQAFQKKVRDLLTDEPPATQAITEGG